MNDVDLALNQISNIRAQLATTTRVWGLSPALNLLLSVAALLLTLVLITEPGLQSEFSQIALWSSVLVASSVVAVAAAIVRARRQHGRLANTLLAALLHKMLPFTVAMVVITWTICQLAPDAIWVLPGLWQILLALQGFSVTANLPSRIVWVAGWYFVTGTLVLISAAQTQSLAPWMMGGPFMIGQLAVALILLNGQEYQEASSE